MIPVIAVASGKGGVGKSTVAANLALALHAAGRKIGLVDADLYGPDIPRMFGLRRRTAARSVNILAASRLEAVNRYGVALSSAAFLLGENQALAVAGPIAQLLVRRLVTDVDWGDADCLILDLPPGTADIQQFVLTMPERPVYALLVVTPQAVAHQDARRLLADLERRSAVTIGGVENMSAIICPCCGKQSPMFPPAPPEDSVWSLVPKLGTIPFSPRAAEDADQGQPVMVTTAVPEQVAAYTRLASRIVAGVLED